jgi:peptidoglycan hydrolase-like protein with peptidoglycan-binding domain
MLTGEIVLPVAEAHQNEPYVLGARVPMNNASYHGPWDCAEFVSWCIYQTYGMLLGTRPTNPSTGDAYTGYWVEDVLAARANIDVGQAIRTKGAILLRRPRTRASGEHAIGHIAISRGDGSTIEARGRKYGVVIVPDAEGRVWDYGALIPGVQYVTGAAPPYAPPAGHLMVTSPFMHGPTVVAVQRALAALGYSPGPIDGVFGPATEAAVYNLQAAEGVATDGVVGPETARLLGLDWPIVPGPGDLAAEQAAATRQQNRLSVLAAAAPGLADDEARPEHAGAPQAEDDAGLAGEATTAAQGAAEIVAFERSEPTPGRFVQHARLADGTRIYVGSETKFTDDMPRRGLFQPSGRLKDIASAGRYDRHEAAALHRHMAHIIWPTVMAESEGYFARLNSYDRAAFTYGCYQAAAHTPDENLVVLFRMLLALPSAQRYFPDLTLVEDDKKIPRVNRKLGSGATQPLENARKVTRPNGVVETQIPDFMSCLNADATRVDDAELTATARLFLWCRDEPEARNAQVRHAISTARHKINGVRRKVASFKAKDWRTVIWVNDIRHQGRGGFKAIADALDSDDALAALALIGMPKYRSRIETVKACIATLQTEDVLDHWSPSDLD